MKNGSTSSLKRSDIEKKTDWLVFSIMMTQIVICAVGASIYAHYSQHQNVDIIYLNELNNDVLEI